MSRANRDTLRMIFGFCLLLIIAALAAAIAMGKVEEKTSYGLMPVLLILSTIGQSFAQWAFSESKKSDKDADTKDSDKNQ